MRHGPAAQAVADLAAQAADRARFQRGRTLHRRAAVEELVVGPSELNAVVEGSRSEPYDVSIAVRPLPAHAVDELADVIADLGRWAAVDQAVEEEVPLVPGVIDTVFSCSCPDWEEPCKHAVATLLAFADLVSDDPEALLTWREVPEELVASNSPDPPEPRSVVASVAGSTGRGDRADRTDLPGAAVEVTEPDPFFVGGVPASGALLAGVPPLEPLPDPFAGRTLLSDGIDAAPVLRDALDVIADVFDRR